MTIIRSTIFCVLVSSLLLTANSHASAAEKLSDILLEAKWDGIIGTWVDADTKGATVNATYAWKIKDRVIEVTTKQGNQETAALMGVNGKTGAVFHMGADSDGTSSLGEWKVEDNGDAVLGIVFTSGDGEDGALSIRHHRVDKDTILVTIELPQPIQFKLIRAKK
ncbi:MAG: hypothetical protein ABGX16_22690 [Pirellulales bacterium]